MRGTQTTERDETTTTPTAEPQPTREAPTATAAPEPTAVALPPGAEQVVRLIKRDLAQRLDLAPDTIQVVSVEAVEWSDTSLGCPQPGLMYAQVITPGFRVVLEAEGEAYEYHADAGRSLVLCGKDGAPIYPLIPIDPDEIQDGKPWMPVDG
jgi:hypothetical protein